MSGKLMGEVYERELEPDLQAVVLAIAEHVNSEDYEKSKITTAYPGVERLAWKLGVSYRVVQRRLRRLEELGVLVVAVEAQPPRTPRTYEINLVAVPVKPAFEAGGRKARERERKNRGASPTSPPAVRGDTGDAPSGGDTQGAKGDTGGAHGATPGASRGDTAASPEPEVNRIGTGKESEPETSNFDKEQFFADKKAKVREELEERTRAGDVWAAAILDSMDREEQAA